MKLTTLLVFVFLVSSAVAKCLPQQQVVTGTVTDATTGNPLPDVNVLIEGTKTGTSTDRYGKFSLPKPDNRSVIVFSFIGYVTEKVTYSGQTVIDIKLSSNVQALEEVVVTGYGTIKKKDLTGSIASVNSKDIEKSTPGNIESALQGRVPGMMVTANSGAPGSQATIRIRGIGTVNNNDPLYVVDGMLIDASQANDATNISFLNPADIASIEVLKDASAQAIYGSRGANGVILITTRKGTEGMPKVTFSSTIGFNNVIKVPKVLNREEFMDYILTCFDNGYIRTNPGVGPNVPLDTLIKHYPLVRYAVPEYNNGTYTNWYNEVLRKNVLNQNYNLSINGGTKYAHYLASAGYLNNDGLIKNYNYQRYSFRLNTDFNVSKYVTIGENLGVTSDKRKSNDYNGPFDSAMGADPLIPVLKPDTLDKSSPNYKYNKYAVSQIGGGNPVLDIALLNWQQSKLTLVGNMFAEAAILKDFKLRTSWGFNLAYTDISDFSPQYYASSRLQNPITTVTSYNGHTNGWVWENTLTYNKTLQDHTITALFGYTSEYAKATNQNATKEGTPNNDPEMQTFDAATIQPNVSGTYKVNSMISYIGRINYSFREKYLLTASMRRDGSSKFGSGHRWGVFPSFALGWNINNEKFFKNLNADFISNLKLRAGWGQIGNSSLPVYYAYVSQVSANSTDWLYPNRYIFGEQVYTGYSLSTIGTPDISWETTAQTNIGLDFGVMKNALSVTADYYIKNTNNMLLQVPVLMYAGYPSSAAPYTNAGSVQNKGFEIVVNYKGKSGDFSYGVTVNGATFKNKVTSLGRGNKPINYEWSRTEVGHPIGSFYGYKVDGIFQSEFWVKSHVRPDGEPIQPNAQVGDFKFKDLNNDGVIDGNDQTYIGNPWPKLTYGFNINIGYKAFDLVAFFQGSWGNDIFDIGMWRHLNFVGSGQEFEYIYKNAWRGPGTSDTNPLLSTVDDNDNYRGSDYFVENGSYMRLKNIQLGYNLPKAICDKLKIINGRIWIGGTNLLTFTKYRGIDPEVGAVSTPTIEEGYDWNNMFPQTREISLGITLSI